MIVLKGKTESLVGACLWYWGTLVQTPCYKMRMVLQLGHITTNPVVLGVLMEPSKQTTAQPKGTDKRKINAESMDNGEVVSKDTDNP